MPAAKVPVGAAVPTALAGASVTVQKAPAGGLELAYPGAGGKTATTPIVATDLTFEGPYSRTSTYVVRRRVPRGLGGAVTICMVWHDCVTLEGAGVREMRASPTRPRPTCATAARCTPLAA